MVYFITLFTSCDVLYSPYLRVVVYFIPVLPHQLIVSCFNVISAIFQPKNCGILARAVVQLTYFEGAFPRVLSDVGSEDTGRSEWLTAVHTLVRTLSTVNLQQRNLHQCCWFMDWILQSVLSYDFIREISVLLLKVEKSISFRMQLKRSINKAERYVYWVNEWTFNIYRECWTLSFAFQTKTPENAFK